MNPNQRVSQPAGPTTCERITTTATQLSGKEAKPKSTCYSLCLWPEAPRRNARLRRSVVISAQGAVVLCQAEQVQAQPPRRPFLQAPQLDWFVAAATTNTQPLAALRSAINRCREAGSQRAESPFLGIFFGAPPLPTPFIFDPHASLRLGAAVDFLFIVRYVL